MGRIERLQTIRHDQLPGVLVYPLTANPRAGEPQEVLVQVEPDREIPLHKHSVDAMMYIVGGSGTVLADDPEIRGRAVSRGDVVFFEKEASHGFHAGQDGLVFVSKNGGIVAPENSAWDIQFV